MRRGIIPVLILAVLMVTPLLAMGCGSASDAAGETSGKPMVIDFWRPGCQPCEEMEPVLEQLEKEYGDQVDFIAYNTMEERGKSEQYAIEFVPTFIFLNAEGEIVDRMVGLVDINTMRDSIKRILPDT
ncbi:MAG: thioredoxin family protein [Actinomycetota bacterium]|nr:thioredoxin family protein [Actinomycetota bacterium]